MESLDFEIKKFELELQKGKDKLKALTAEEDKLKVVIAHQTACIEVLCAVEDTMEQMKARVQMKNDELRM